MTMPTYRVEPFDPAGHRFRVTLTLAALAPDGQLLSLPTWIPGSYLIREFARNWTRLEAHDARGPVSLRRIDKSTWQAPPDCVAPLVVTAEVYAWDLSVRSAHLDRTHGYFNGTSLFLRPHGQDEAPCEVELVTPDDPTCTDWRVATTLDRKSGDAWGFGRFTAGDYDELIDHPVEMGTFRLLSFEASGVPHHVALTGRLPEDLDEERLLTDLTAICEAQHTMMEHVPLEQYLFQVMVVGKGYGGLEHRSSTSLVCNRSDLPTRTMSDKPAEGYQNLLGLASHEYFHLYNVKRIKPAAFTPYDLSREGHTTLLWAFEGITSYVDDLTLVRCGRIEPSTYLELLGRTFTRVERTPGRLVQTLADSSFDAWTKFYRQDENSPNALISYYAKGALVALALDLTLRARTAGRCTLDEVMRVLYQRHGETGIGVPEDGIETVAAEVSGIDLSTFFDQAIRSTEDLPFAELLAPFGVTLHRRPARSATDKGGNKGKDVDALRKRGWLGATVRASDGAKLHQVLLDGPAHRAGLASGDVVIALGRLKVTAKDLRVRCASHPPGTTLHVHAFRRDELFTTTLTLGAPPETTIYLTMEDDAPKAAKTLREAWLGL